MLKKDITKILFDENGKVCGIQAGEEVAKAKTVICSPTYLLSTNNANKLKSVGKIIRCICIMDHPIPNTNNVPSLQIIIPQKQTGRKSG